MEADTSDEESTGLNKRLSEALEHPLRARMFAEMSKALLREAELAALLRLPLAQTRYHYEVLERLGGVRAANEIREAES